MMGTGATLAYNCSTNMWLYTAHDGTVYGIDPALPTDLNCGLNGCSGSTYGALRWIQRPSGEVVTYHYANASGGAVTSITNNRGYQLKFIYGASTGAITQVIGINNAVDYCDPGPSACSGFNGNIGPSGTAWPSISFSYPNGANGNYPAGSGSGHWMTETDALGNVTTYDGDYLNPGYNITMTSPAGLVVTYQDGHDNEPMDNPYVNTDPVTSSVVVNGKSYTYKYTCDAQQSVQSHDDKWFGTFCSTAHVTRTDPAGGVRRVDLSLAYCGPACDPYNLYQPNWILLVTGPFLVEKVTDELGRVTNYGYDYHNRLGLIGHPEGNYSYVTFDGDDSQSRGNVLTTTNVPKSGSGLANIVFSATYDATCTNPLTCNEPNTTTDANGNVTSYTYDTNTGLVLTKTDPSDASGVQPQTRYSYSQVATYGYSAPGSWSQLGSIWEPTAVSECRAGTASSCVGTANEDLTTTSYSGSNNALPTSITKGAGSGSWALNLTTSFYYMPQGDLEATIDPRGDQTDYGYDAMRRKIAEGHLTGASLPWLAYTAYAYDADGRPTQEYRATGFDANNSATGWELSQTTYTPTGKVATKVDPLGNTTTYGYDALDRLVSLTDPTSRVTTYAYDAASQKTQERRAVGTPLEEAYETLTYSQNGKVLSETDARGNAITLSYDGFDRLYRTTYADATYEQNDYDANSNVTILTNRGGFALVRCYDALNRKISERGITGATNTGSCPTGGTPNVNSRWWDIRDLTFSYDLTGRQLTADSGWGWFRHSTYDAAGRLLTHQDNFGFYTYAYDAAGNMVSLDYPGGVLATYQYDPLNRMTGAWLNGAAVATLTYDTLSRRTGLTYGDGSSVSYGYDAADRLTSQSHVFPATPGSNVTYTFGYDGADRDTQRTISNPAYTEVQAPSTAYATADALNHYPTVNGAAQTYWAEGGLQSAGPITRYYDETGGFAVAYNAANSDDLAFQPRDALGQTFQLQRNDIAGTDTLIYQGHGGLRPEILIDDLDTAPHDSGTYTWQGNRYYVLGPNPDERLAFLDMNGTVYYPHVDRQGSTIAMSISGQDVLTRTYGPYGELNPTGPQLTLAPGASAYPYLYTGQRYDAYLAAYDYKARIYDPKDGRFWQPDPIGATDDINLYSYTRNDPLDGTDPSGNSILPGVCGNAPGCLGAGSSSAAEPITEVVVTAARKAAPAGKLVAKLVFSVLKWSDLPLDVYNFWSMGTKGSDVCGGHGLPSCASLISESRVPKPRPPSRPWKGTAGSTVWVPGQGGRRYGVDGYPEVDVDIGHDHGAGDPHAHDIGRPVSGDPPTHDDRDDGRPMQPGDPVPP